MKKKKVLITISLVTILLLSVFIFNYINEDREVIASGKENSILESDGMFSFMLETSPGSGKYTVSSDTKWPGSGYKYNERLSGCENGSTLIWNDEAKSVTLKANKSDKCYLYFDIVPPDVTLAATNADNSHGAAPATLSCNGATSSYNQKYRRVEISQIDNSYTNCTLTYGTPSSTNYLNNYIIGLSGTTQGTGQVVNENGYRYEGKNPNNYIWFNNELWRIIGVFDENSHGQSGQNLVKIIRNESIGGLAWHKSNTNDWTASSLMNLLNGAYLNAEDGTDSGYCYGYSTTVPSNCDYTSIGISATYRSMIANAKWYLEGYSSTSATAEAFYGYERGTTVSSGMPTSTTGYIGLMYPSDYGYSVLASSCARTTNLSSYNSSSCAGESWLYGQGYEWTITPGSSSSSSVFFVYNNGSLSSYSARYGYSARPSLYLDSSVYVVDGNGSMSDPYIIGM